MATPTDNQPSAGRQLLNEEVATFATWLFNRPHFAETVSKWRDELAALEAAALAKIPKE